MAFASMDTYMGGEGDSSIIGYFQEKEIGHAFEFSQNNDIDTEEMFTEYPHKIWVNTAITKFNTMRYRYGLVKKTVVYIVVDEDENGLVVEKWQIKNHEIYDRI